MTPADSVICLLFAYYTRHLSHAICKQYSSISVAAAVQPDMRASHAANKSMQLYLPDMQTIKLSEMCISVV